MTRTVYIKGVKYATASHRRFVVFSHDNDGKPYIVKRSDNLNTAKAWLVKDGDVLVDFVARKYKWDNASLERGNNTAWNAADN